MPNKALVTGIDGPTLSNGVYAMGVMANLQDDIEGTIGLNVQVSSSTFNIGTWKDKAAAAIKTEALDVHQVVVDKVMFQDFTIVDV
jgi:hypothetical protein